MNRRMIPAGSSGERVCGGGLSLDLQVKQGLCGAVLQVKAFRTPAGGEAGGARAKKIARPSLK